MIRIEILSGKSSPLACCLVELFFRVVLTNVLRGSNVNKKKVSFRKFLAVRCDAGAGRMHCFKSFFLWNIDIRRFL